MSLSKEPAYSELKSHFVMGYRNIMNEPYAGNSGTHKPNGNAVDTTNGAGPHNIQLFLMNPDGTVVHCLPGYWNAEDLRRELDLARQLNDLYKNPTLNAEQKANQFKQVQLAHFRYHPAEMTERSHLQGFDMKAEAHKPNSDAIKDRSYLADGEWGPESCKAFKTTDQLMHERMAARPFVTYGAFDVAKFADYGTETYDKHEDSLDENGHRIASGDEEEKMKFEPIKNRRSVEAVRRAHAARPPVIETAARKNCGPMAYDKPPVRKNYVKTYGRVKYTYGNL